MLVRTALSLMLLFLACAGPGPRSRSVEPVPEAKTVAPAPGGGSRSRDANGDRLSDEYVSKTQTYRNNTVGFRLTFDRSWIVWPHHNTMPPQLQKIAAQMEESGAEVLLFASTSDKTRWLRVSAEETNLPLAQYFGLIRQANEREIVADEHELVRLGKADAVSWIFQSQSNGLVFKYQEYQVKRGAFNLRMSFWTLLALFDSRREGFAQVGGTYAEL